MSKNWKQLLSLFKRLPLLQVFVVLGIFSLLRFYPFLLGKTVYFGDNYSLMVPGKIFTAQWLSQGMLPLWNPYIFAGVNWIADINQSVLYFTTFLFWWFSPATALNLSIFLHTLGTGIGMYFFAKRLVPERWQAILAATLWMFSTQVSGSSNNLTTIQSIAWIPWILYAGSFIYTSVTARGVFALLVLAQFLSGYPQHVIYSIAMSVVFSSWEVWKKTTLKKWAISWLVTGTITLFVTAVAWLPFAESLLGSTRMIQSTTQAQVGSLDPKMLPKMVLTYIFDNPVAGMKWGPAWSGQPNVLFYVTWLGLIAISYSLILWKKIKTDLVVFSAVVVVSTLIFSFGKYLPFFEQIQQIIPLLRVGRYPSMVLMFTNLWLIVWTVAVIPKLSFSKVIRRLLWIFLALMVVIAGLVWYAALQLPTELWNFLNLLTKQALETSQFHTAARDMVILRVISENIVVVSILTMCGLWAIGHKRWWWVVTFLTIELLYSTQGMFIFANGEVYSDTVIESVTQRQAIQNVVQTSQYRILTRNSNQPYSDFGSYWEALVVRAPFSDSFVDEYELYTHERLRALKDGFTPDWNMVFGVPTIHGYTSLLPQDFADIWQESEQARINFVDTIPSSHPQLRDWAVKYYLVDRWYPLYSEKLPAKKIATVGDWEVYELENTLPRFRMSDDTPVKIAQLQETPNTISLRLADGQTAGTLIIADRYDVNWKAWADGKPVKLRNWNGMRQLELPANTQQLELRFLPSLFYLGGSISLVTVLIIGWWWYSHSFSRRK